MATHTSTQLKFWIDYARLLILFDSSKLFNKIITMDLDCSRYKIIVIGESPLPVIFHSSHQSNDEGFKTSNEQSSHESGQRSISLSNCNGIATPNNAKTLFKDLAIIMGCDTPLHVEYSGEQGRETFG